MSTKTAKDDQYNIGFLLKESGKHKYKIYLSILLSILSSLCKLMPYILVYQIIVQVTSTSPDIDIIKKYALYTGLAVIANLLFTVGCLASSHLAAFSILYDIRIRAVKKMGGLNLGYFRKNSIGELKKYLDEDVEKLELFIAHQIPDFFESIITPLIVISYLLYLKWWLALLLFIPFLIALMSQWKMYSSYGEEMETYNSYVKKLHGTIVQYIHGMNVFKAFNLTAANFRKYVDIVNGYLDNWIRMCDNTIPAFAFAMALIDSGGLLIVIPAGGLSYIAGGLSFASYVIFLLLGTVFLTSFMKIMTLGGNLALLLTGAENVRNILESLDQQRDGNLELKNPEGIIEYRNVCFGYSDKEVIHDLSLKIEKNTTLALVGPSGSGKTTLGMLAGRFWDVEKGEILIDGKPINEIQMQDLMEATSFVFQDIFMLNDTLYNNIVLGMKKSEHEVIEACKKAQIHDFIASTPDGYNTVIGEGAGIKLSGGEMQRISIARAILKNAKIVILDEVTSYSDIDNEVNIQKALKNLLDGKTAIIIAHRLYTIKNADNIVVLDEGKIVEQGVHEELLSKQGLYHQLWNIGTEGY